jgi:hypothetical protein
MPLPSNFSPTEHLQDLIKRTVNKEVKEWFYDVTEDDLSTNRASLRVGCLHEEADTMNMTIGRLMLFYNIVGAFPHQRGFMAPDREVFRLSGNPQVILLFVETAQSFNARKAPRRAEMRCSFRIMSEQFDSASDEAKIEAIERKLRQEFPPQYSHKTGQTSYTYVDRQEGYQLRVPGYSESEVKILIRKLLDCNIKSGITYDEARFTRASTKNPVKIPAKRVLGKTLKKEEPRPTASVKLRQADLFIPGWGSKTLIYRNLS